MNDVEFEYWRKFYERGSTFEPSDFCKWALPRITGSTVFDLGCGNGRDTEYIARELPVMGVDPHAPKFKAEFRYHHMPVEEFMVLVPCHQFDTVYSRWFFHAIDEELETRILDWTKGQLIIEARVVNDDPLPADHYRRPLDPDKFLKKLENWGYQLEYFEVGRGMSVVGDDDPELMRVDAYR